MNHKVIVIGGGMSGLSACVKLLESGIQDFVLIEGNDRLGGRINTISFQNSFIELGAQWIHGTKGNPIFELSKALNLVDEKKERDDSMYYATQDGTQLDEDYVERIFNKIENIFDNLEDLIENELDDDSNQNLGSLVDESFIKILKKLKSSENSNVELIKAIYRARLSEEKNETACSDLYKLSAVGWNEYEDFEGEQYAKLKHGYGKLLEYFYTQIPRESIKLNEIVEKIDYSSSDNINEVTVFNSIDKTRKTYKSNFVLCTMSLGYLKKHHYDLFNPKLSLNKIKAIENLGFGCVNKVFVVFENQVFKRGYEGLKILWRDDIPFKLDAIEKWNLQNNKFFKSFDNFEVLPYSSNVLVGFIVGEDAIYCESLEEECLIDIIYELFTKCFQKLNFPRPNKVILTKWSSNHLTNGSYSFIKTGSNINDVKNLAQPLNDKIFFAGEGTTYKYISTVHGAYISGREAANKIVKAMR